MKHPILLLAILLIAEYCCSPVWAQDQRPQKDWQSLRDGWFIQLGGDWTIQNPYGYPAKGMITNGSTLGIDAAFGRWFTHEFGLRAKMSWGNGIIDTKPNWLAPFYQPGVNHQKGGFLSLTGDVLLDLRNIAVGYDKRAIWNPQLILRAGGVYNFGCNKGAPLIGIGWGNTFRVHPNWGLYADAVFNGVSSGFTMDPSTATGTGTGANSYFTFDIGATYYFDSNHATTPQEYPSVLKGGTFWRRWFVQAGVDMTMYNPCEKNFREVFPKGVAMGLDFSVGKWFSPEVGLRGRVNLENMFVENKKLEWAGYDKTKHKSNFDGGGIVMVYADVLLSLKHLFILPWEENERWDLYAFGRMGLSCNLSLKSCSPVVGVGLGSSIRLYRWLSLYMDTCYEGTTTEFFANVGSWSGPTGSRFNGIWDVNLGLQVEFPCKK